MASRLYASASVPVGVRSCHILCHSLAYGKCAVSSCQDPQSPWKREHNYSSFILETKIKESQSIHHNYWIDLIRKPVQSPSSYGTVLEAKRGRKMMCPSKKPTSPRFLCRRGCHRTRLWPRDGSSSHWLDFQEASSEEGVPYALPYTLSPPPW